MVFAVPTVQATCNADFNTSMHTLSDGKRELRGSVTMSSDCTNTSLYDVVWDVEAKYELPDVWVDTYGNEIRATEHKLWRGLGQKFKNSIPDREGGSNAVEIGGAGSFNYILNYIPFNPGWPIPVIPGRYLDSDGNVFDSRIGDIPEDGVFALGITHTLSGELKCQNNTTPPFEVEAYNRYCIGSGTDGFQDNPRCTPIWRVVNIYGADCPGNGPKVPTVRGGLGSPPSPGLIVSCVAEPDTGNTGDEIVWKAFPQGGTGLYTFDWTLFDSDYSFSVGNEGLKYIDTYVRYDNDGQKTGQVRVMSGSQTATSNICNANIGNVPSKPTTAPLIADMTASCGAQTINLTWTSVTGATSYNIYVDGVFLTNTTSRSFSHTNLTAGNTHAYVIRGVNSAGEGPSSAQYFDTVPYTCLSTLACGATESTATIGESVSWVALFASGGKAPFTYTFSGTSNYSQVVTDASRSITAPAISYTTPGIKTASVIIASSDNQTSAETVCSTSVEIKAPLTVTVVGSGGTVNSSPGGIVNCSSTGGDCTENYSANTLVTLTASPQTGWTTSWSGCDSSSGNTCTVTMSTTKAVTTTFTQNTFTLTVSKTGNGSISSTNVSGISCGSDCTNTYNANQTVTLRPTEDDGWAFKEWTGSGCSVSGSDCTVTMSANRNVTAVFEQPTPIGVALSATPSTVSYNGSTDIAWRISGGTTANVCTASNSWTDIKNNSGGTETKSNLTNHSTYTLSCTDGNSTDSKSVTVGVLPSSTTLSASAGSCGTRRVNLSWTTASLTTGYTLESSTNGSTYTTVATGITTTTYSATELIAGTQYYFRIIPTNAYGNGPTSNVVSVVAPWNCLSVACSLESAVSTSVNTNVTWGVSSLTGGSGTYNYTWSDTGGGTQSGTGVSTIPDYVKSFSSANSYTGNLLVTSSDGQSTTRSCGTVTVNPASSIGVTLAVSPNPVNYANSTTISWTTTGNPTSCEATEGSGFWLQNKTKSTAGSYQNTGLLINDTYFEIMCSKSGTNSVIAGVDVHVKPERPTILSVSQLSCGSDSVSVEWNNSAHADTYVLEYSTNPAFPGGNTTQISGITSTSYTVGGLTPGYVYYFRVKGRNSYGDSMASSLGFGKGPWDCVTASCSVTPSTITTGESASWNATTSGGSGTYTYIWTGTGGLSGTSNPQTKTYSQAGGYTGSVQVSSGGLSSTASCGNTLTVNPPNSVFVDIAANDNDGPITVQSGSNVDLSWRTWNYPTSCTASGAWNGSRSASSGTTYTETKNNVTADSTYTLACTRSTDNSSDTDSVEVKVIASPNRPTVIPGETCSGEIAVRWTPVANADSYNIYTNGATSPSRTDIRGTEYIHSGLDPNSLYFYRVSAVRDGVESELSPSQGVRAPDCQSITASCSASPNPAEIGDTITWTGTVSGGVAPYDFTWQGTISATESGDSPSVQTNSYSTSGTTRFANFSVNDSANPPTGASTSCSVAVDDVVVESFEFGISALPTFYVDIPTAGESVTSRQVFVTQTKGASDTKEDIALRLPTPPEGVRFELASTGGYPYGCLSTELPCTRYLRIIVDATANPGTTVHSLSGVSNSFGTNENFSLVLGAANNIDVTCEAVDAKSVRITETTIGTPVVWRIRSINPPDTGSYTYSWTGSSGLSGNTPEVRTVYTTVGTKTGQVSIGPKGDTCPQAQIEVFVNPTFEEI